jgi:hypothetical protein
MDLLVSKYFYDLSTDLTNDAIVFVGGINIHRSINSGGA